MKWIPISVNRYKKYKRIIQYGLLSGLLIFLLKWLQWKLLIMDNFLEIYIGLIAIFFTGLGIWVASQWAKPKIKTLVIEKEVLVHSESFMLDETELKKWNLSNREYEVLQLIVKGKSNLEIAESLFLSVSTIKTHASNLFVKMNVKSRAQAIEKARRLHIVP